MTQAQVPGNQFTNSLLLSQAPSNADRSANALQDQSAKKGSTACTAVQVCQQQIRQVERAS